jgi:phenylacetate-CoA ligase
MFTIYHPELHEVATRVHRMNREFFAGQWSPNELHAYQLEGLKETLRYVKRGSPFYQRHLADFDDRFIDKLTLDSFAELPFTSKDDLRREMRDMMSKPLADCCFFYETTGTTGTATPCPRDYVDTIYNNMAVTSCLETILKGGERKHFVGVCGPTELHSFGDTLGDVCKNLGLGMAKFWAYSPVIGLRKSVETLRELGITALMCTPGMALTTAKLAHQLGYDLKRDFALEVIMLTGELGSPAMMKNIESLFGARTYNFLYGAQEALVLATVVRTGRMHVFPVNYFYEVIDPATGRRVEAVDGVRAGELVISMLFQGSKPLVRYRTGDFVRLHEAARDDLFPSPVVEVLGRTRDALEINGHRIQGYDLEQLLMERVPPALGYQITISNEGVDRLAITLELLGGGEDAACARAVEAALGERLGVATTVRFGELGSIGSTGALVSWKAARIVDTRPPKGGDPELAARLAEERRIAEQIAATRDLQLARAVTRS